MQKIKYLRRTGSTKLIIVISLITLGNLSAFLFCSISDISQYENHEFNNLNEPKTSAGEITIITPENKTYTKAMNGYYLGTTGLEDTDNGLLPSNMDDTPSGSNCQATVVAEKSGHNKVVHIDDDGVSTRVRLNYNFTDIDYGFLEFWVYAEDATDGLVTQWIDDDSDTEMFRFQMNLDKWNYYDGASWIAISAFDGVYDPQDNTWYRLTVHFRGNSAPAYQGLNENQFKLIVDGHDSGGINFHTSGSSIERLRFFTGDTPTSDFWVDAFGTTNDLEYNIGDNRYKGLLLSFENSTTLDWIGYSLDNQNNKTIMGNTTIRMLDPGLHTIQVFGNTSLGTMYQSSIRYFSVSPINLITPDFIPFLLIGIGIGLVALIGIGIFLYSRRRTPKTPIKARTDEKPHPGSDKLKVCPFCFAQIKINAKFCISCGASLEKD